MKERRTGKQRRSAPSKRTRSRIAQREITPFNFELLNAERESQLHWLGSLLILTTVAPLIPRVAGAPEIIKNTTHISGSTQAISTANNSSLSAIPVIDSSRKPAQNTAVRIPPIIPKRSASSTKVKTRRNKLFQDKELDFNTPPPSLPNVAESAHTSVYVNSSLSMTTNHIETNSKVSPTESINLSESQYYFLHYIHEGNYREVQQRIVDGSSGPLNYIFDGGGRNVTYMHLLAMSGYIDLIKLLQSNGVSINQVMDGYTPLASAIYAIKRPQPVSFIQEMIEAGADPYFELDEIPSNLKKIVLLKNPAYNAIFLQQRIDVLDLFLEKNYITLRNAFSYSLLFPFRDTVAYIFNRGIDLNDRDSNGNTYLHWAVMNNLNSVTHLLEYAPHLINTMNNNGDTPLHIAVENDRLEMIPILLKGGADPKIENRAGATAADKATNPTMRKFFHIPPPEFGTSRLWNRSAGNLTAPLQHNPYRLDAKSHRVITSKAVNELTASDCHVIEQYIKGDEYRKFCLFKLTEPDNALFDKAVKDGAAALIADNLALCNQIFSMWNKSQRKDLKKKIVVLANQLDRFAHFSHFREQDNSDNNDIFHHPHFVFRTPTQSVYDRYTFATAIRNNNRQTYNRLIDERRVDLSSVVTDEQNFNMTILQYTCLANDEFLTEKLLSLGLDANEIFSGDSALHFTVKRNKEKSHFAVIKKLILYDADPFLVNSEGFTALDLAEQQGDSELTALLQQSIRGRKLPLVPLMPIKSKQGSYFRRLVNYADAYKSTFSIVAALITIIQVAIMYWLRDRYVRNTAAARANQRQQFITMHEKYIKDILKKFFDVKQISQSSLKISLSLALRPDHDLQWELKDLYSGNTQLPRISIDVKKLVELITKLLAEFYGASAVSWQDNNLTINMSAVLEQTPPPTKRSDFSRIANILIEASPDFLEEKSKAEVLNKYKDILASAKSKRDAFLAERKGFDDFIAHSRITTALLDSYKNKSGKIAGQAHKIKETMTKISFIVTDNNNKREEMNKMYLENYVLPTVYSAFTVQQAIASLQSVDVYYSDLNQQLLKQYNKKFVTLIAEFSRSKKMESVDSSSSRSNQGSKKWDDLEVDEESREINESEAEKAEEQQEHENQQQKKQQQLQKVQQEQQGQNEPVNQAETQPLSQPSTTLPKQQTFQVTVNNKNMLFSPMPLPTATPTTNENNRRIKAKQKPIPMSPEELVKRIKDHALDLSLLVAMVKDYDFSNPSERTLYRYALFYHLLRLFHGLWLLKLGNPDENIQLNELKTIRHFLAHDPTKASEDDLFIFARNIKEKLFPDPITTTKKDKLEIQFRDRLKDIDIKKTELYQDIKLIHDKGKEVIISERACYLKIDECFKSAQSLFKIVESGYTFQCNPDRTAAIKALLAIIGDYFMQIRDYHPECWERLESHTGIKYFEGFIRFRNGVYHRFNQQVDIENYKLYDASRSLLSAEVEAMFKDLKQIFPELSVPQSKP